MIKNYIKFYKITCYASASIDSPEVFSTLLSYQVLYSVPVTPQGVYVKHSGKLNRTSVFYLLMSNHHFYNSPARDFAVWNTNVIWKKLKEKNMFCSLVLELLNYFCTTYNATRLPVPLLSHNLTKLELSEIKTLMIYTQRIFWIGTIYYSSLALITFYPHRGKDLK